MTKIQDRIHEINKIAKRSRLITTVLAIIIVAFIVLTVWNMNTISNNNVTINSKNDSLNVVNEELKFLKGQIEDKEIKYKNELRQIVDSIAQANQGSNLWENTKSTNTIDGFAKYIETERDNNSVIEPERITEIKDAVDAIMDQNGWIQIEESNGTKLFAELGNYIDNISDLRKAKSARSVRNGIIGDSKYDSSRNGDVISKDQFVIVVNTVSSGKAVWAQIKYSNNN